MKLSEIKGLSNEVRAKITEINLHNVGLSSFPEELFELENLQILYISFNNIPEIPQKIKLFKKLRLINISNNKITKLPNEMSELKNLEHLYLSNNEFKVFPIEIQFIPKLKTLSLSGNRIKTLPDDVKGFKKLTKLFLEDNQLDKLPKKYAFLPSLNLIELNGNILRTPPLEIINQGVPAIRNYFNSIDDAKETYKVFEAKLLIVGDGNVGKTCLMEKLIDSSKDITATVFSTEGIDIKRWFVKTKNYDDFRINVWDFGGQEIYHSTHQFFLTKRSLYIFVWTARTDDNIISFDYWLNVIKLLSDNAPVLVVMNKIDERIKMIDEQSIKFKFDNIVDFLKISTLKGTGMTELTDRIKLEMEKLPHIGDTLPKAWVDIRNKLENLGKNYILLSEYKFICSEYGLNDEQALYLSHYFHDLGVILHFQENDILKGIVFLKPEWATNAVYKISDTKQIQLDFGKFKFSELKDIWESYDEDNFKYLIELMKKFELCFKLNENEYIVPELLSEAKPISFHEWNPKDNLIFEYHYDFMPTGIITRFIVRVHDMIYDSNYWKNGAIIRRTETFRDPKTDLRKKENTDALILNIPLERKIRISIRGYDRTQLLGIIRREIDYIHRTLNYPDFKEMIPCKCSTCNASQDKNMYSYKDLKVYLENDEKTIFCTYGKTRVSVASLLEGIEKFYNPSKNINTVNITRSKVVISD